MSVCTNASAAAITIVMAAITMITLDDGPRMSSPVKNTGYKRATRNTPATTIVEECNSELTGVGPAIASGSQVCSGNWPLLPMAAMNKANAATKMTVEFGSPDSAQAEIPRIENPDRPRFVVVQSLAAKNSMLMPTSKPTSPVRTVKNAFSAARLLAPSSHQWPMSMNEHRPMISQPSKNKIMSSAITMANMPAENNVSAAKKWV